MYNSLTRLQNVFGYFTTVAATVACAIALLSFVSTPVPNIKETGLLLNNIQTVKGRPYYSSKREEFVHIKFDLDIDLSQLFTWNTKQVFLYVTATYPSRTPGIAPSQAIIWDAVLPHPLAPEHTNTYVYPEDRKSKGSKSKSAAKEPLKSVPGILRLDSRRPKYQINDPTGRIAERANATLELNWNIQPWVGALTWAAAPSRSAGAAAPGWLAWLSAWNAISSPGARTEPFEFPPVKERNEAVKAAGKHGLDVERGGEGNRGRPA